MADDTVTPAPASLPEVTVNAQAPSPDVSDFSSAIGAMDPALGRVEKSIEAEDDPKIKAYEAQAQAHQQRAAELDKQAADLSQKMAEAFKDQMPQVEQYLANTPNRQAMYASTMHVTPLLAVLTALGGKMTRASGLEMLSAQTGIIQGVNQGNEQAYQDAVARWKTGLDKMQTQMKMEGQYYQMMLKAYSGRADAEEKAAAAVERMAGNVRTDEQKKLQTAAQARNAQLRLAEQLETHDLMRQRLDIERQKLAMKGTPGELPPGWTPQMVNYYAERGLRGDYSWRTGLSRSTSGAAIIAAIDGRVAQMADERDIRGGEAAAIPAEAKALTHALTTRTDYLEAVKPAVANFNEEAQIVRDMLKPGAGGQSPLWNKYQQYARGQIAGDADVTALETALVGAGREHQRIITGPKSNAQMHQGAQDRADQLLNINQNANQIMRNLSVMEREGQNFVRANQEDALDIRRQIAALGEGPQLDKSVTPPPFTVPGALNAPPGAGAKAPPAAAPSPPAGSNLQAPGMLKSPTGSTFQRSGVDSQGRQWNYFSDGLLQDQATGQFWQRGPDGKYKRLGAGPPPAQAPQ